MSAEPLSPVERTEKLARLHQAFTAFVPHNKALGLLFEDFGEGEASLRLPWREDLVGNPATQALHGGALTTLLDATLGAAVFLRTWEPKPIATLDLRIDFMKPAVPRRDLIAKAVCYAMRRNVAFVRGIAFHDESDPIATAAATFMLDTRGKSALSRAK